MGGAINHSRDVIYLLEMAPGSRRNSKGEHSETVAISVETIEAEIRRRINYRA